jgi:hypothetical protein
MTEAETVLQMAARHLAEQKLRVHEQEKLIVRLRSEGRPSDQAEGMLVEMRNLLDDTPHRHNLVTARRGWRVAVRSPLIHRAAAFVE